MDCTQQGGISDAFQSDPNYRGIVLGIIGKVPDVGGAMSLVTSLFWPDDVAKNLYAAMVAYVNKLVPSLIAASQVKMLTDTVQGLRDNLQNYKATTNLQDKGQQLNYVLGACVTNGPAIFDLGFAQAAQMLPNFITFATIHLTALREKYLFAPQYYAGPDSDRNAHRQALQAAITKYSAAAEKLSADAMVWRLGQITRVTGTISVAHGHGHNSWPAGHAQDDYCGWSGPDVKGDGMTGYNGRIRIVRAIFGQDLGAILAPTLDWPKLMPAA